ncbi:MAG: ATPase, partial [Clostridia bacterium]|nr:ATPase [Clostridia bacterium]
MLIHTKSINTVLSELSTDAKLGLSGAAAKERLEKNGENRLNEKKKKSLVRRFFEQFYDAMIIILIVAAIVSFAIAIVEGNPKEFFEPC